MRGRLLTQGDFRGGLNLMAAYALEPNESRDCLNVRSTPQGAVQKRPGNVTFSSPADTLHSLYGVQSIATRVLVGAGGTSIYKISAAGTATAIKTGVTSGKRWEFAEFPIVSGQGPVYMMNGTDTPQQWDGVAGATSNWTAAAANNLPNGTMMLVAGNRLFVAGMSAYTPSGGTALTDAPSFVAFSQIGDPTTWPAQNVVGFDPKDGGAITGIGTVGPYVVVFKERKAWIIYDLDTGANRRIGANVGCVAPRSIVETPVGTFFLSLDQGIMITDGSGVRMAAENVRPLTNQIVPAQRSIAAGVFSDGHYLLSICTAGTANNQTLDMDTHLLTVRGGHFTWWRYVFNWWLHSFAAQDYAAWEAATTPELYGAPNAARVDKLLVAGQTQDNGANYPAYWTQGHESMGQTHLKKRLRQVAFDGTGWIDFYIAKDFAQLPTLDGSFNFSSTEGVWGTDDGSTWGTDDGSVWGGSSSVQEARAYTLGTGRTWSVKFGNNTNLGFEIDSFTMAYEMGKN
jgi:hypothetical protein